MKKKKNNTLDAEKNNVFKRKEYSVVTTDSTVIPQNLPFWQNFQISLGAHTLSMWLREGWPYSKTQGQILISLSHLGVSIISANSRTFSVSRRDVLLGEFYFLLGKMSLLLRRILQQLPSPIGHYHAWAWCLELLKQSDLLEGIQAEDGANMRWQSGEPERNWCLNGILVHIIPPSHGTSSKSWLPLL